MRRQLTIAIRESLTITKIRNADWKLGTRTKISNRRDTKIEEFNEELKLRIRLTNRNSRSRKAQRQFRRQIQIDIREVE